MKESEERKVGCYFADDADFIMSSCTFCFNDKIAFSVSKHKQI